MKVVADGNRDTWNAFVSAQPASSIYQSYEWGQIRKAQGWEPHYLAVVDGQSWIAAALVLVKRLPGGFGTLLYSPCGPVIGQHATTDMAAPLASLILAVRELAHQAGGIFWRIEPRLCADDLKGGDLFERIGFLCVPQEWSYWNRAKYDMHLHLTGGESAVFSRINSRTRGKIRYAPKQGVVVNVGHGNQDVEIFYRLLMKTGAKKHIPVRDLDYFTTLYWSLEKAGIGRLFMARKGGKAVAAGMSSRFGSVASLLYLSNDYSVKYVGYAVQWQMLRWAIAEGCTVYDFAGTATNYPPQETDKGYGVYRFKRSFGAEIVAWYGYADYVFRPSLYGFFRAVERSLPYGERFCLDWPKGFLQWLRSRKKAVESSVATGSGKHGDH